jgi:hypothetical protein
MIAIKCPIHFLFGNNILIQNRLIFAPVLKKLLIKKGGGNWPCETLATILTVERKRC